MYAAKLQVEPILLPVGLGILTSVVSIRNTTTYNTQAACTMHTRLVVLLPLTDR